MIKTCPSCLVKPSRKENRNAYCLECEASRSRARYRNLTPENKRNKSLKRQHGISYEQFVELASKQNYKCAGCLKSIDTLDKNFCVDHCHVSKKIRGVLCHNCNLALGHLKDNTETMTRLMEYINVNN